MGAVVHFIRTFDEIRNIRIVVFKFPNGKFKSVWWMPRLKMAMKDVAWLR